MQDIATQAPPDRRHVRLSLTLAATWCALAALATGLAWLARDSSTVEAQTRAHHAETLALPAESFSRDAANRISGRVLTRAGTPLPDASVLVFDATELLERIDGDVSRVEPEAACRTDAEGRFEFADLPYGAKHVLIQAEGHEDGALAGLSLCDGYGVQDQVVVLAPARPWTVLLEGADDAPGPADVLVRAFPRGFARAVWEGRSDAEGRVALPGELIVDAALPRLLVGEPPQAFAPAAADLVDGQVALRMAPRSDLRVALSGVADGELRARLWPESARSEGVREVRGSIQDGAIVLHDVPAVELGLELEIDGKVVAWYGVPSGDTLSLTPVRREPFMLHGHEHPDLLDWTDLAWSPRATRPPPDSLAEPWPWRERRDPGRRALELRSFGDGLALELPAPTGWLSGRDGAGWWRELRLPLEERGEPSTVLEVRSFRPFQAVRIDSDTGHAALGWTDAMGSANLALALGPHVVRTTFEGGRWSWPRGAWCEGPTSFLRVELADRRYSELGVCFGFVTRFEGGPARAAEVFLQPWGSIPRRGETDEHGYFSYRSLGPQSYAVVARPAKDLRAVRYPRSIELSPGGPREQRLDLNLFAYQVQEHLDPAWAGEDIELLDAQGEILWADSADEHGRVRFTNLREGDYVLRRRDSDGPTLSVRSALPSDDLEHRHTHAEVGS